MANDTAQATSVEQRLKALEAGEAARTILARYAKAVDAQSVEGIRELLADDVVLDVGHAVEGADAVTEFFAKAFKDDPAEKSHFITNIDVRRLDDDRASVETYFLWTAADDTTSLLGWGTYAHEVVVQDGTARFSKMSLAIRRMADVREGWMTGAS
jgi:predicted SnoaL-like aldol condensation-catalyzing enzyme